MLDSDSIFRISKKVVEQAASAGNCVIVGRGAQHFLQDRNDTLRFFLYARTQNKVQRLVSEGRSREHASALVDTVDHERAAFIKNYFHVDWPNREVYDAMINTAAGDEAVIETIMSFVKRAQPKSPAAERVIAIHQ
jgi:uncharacterized protein